MPFLELLERRILAIRLFGTVKPLYVKLDGALFLLVEAQPTGTVGVFLKDSAQLAALAEGDFETALEHGDGLGLFHICELEEERVVGVYLADTVV